MDEGRELGDRFISRIGLDPARFRADAVRPDSNGAGRPEGAGRVADGQNGAGPRRIVLGGPGDKSLDAVELGGVMIELDPRLRELAEAAMEQATRIEEAEFVRKIEGQTEVINGVPTATGEWMKHAQVQISRASGRLKRAVEAFS